MIHPSSMSFHKWLYGTFALLLSTMTPANAYAQLSESETYYIKSYSSDQVLSNGSSDDKDTYLFMEDVSETETGQKWTLQAVSGTDNCFIVVNAGHPTMAIDVAPTSNYRLLQWTASTSSANQQLVIQAVEGLENTYQMLWKSNTSMVVTEQTSGSLTLGTDLTSESTYFVFEVTTPQELPEPNDWENEEFFEENKLPAHATFMPYASTEKLRADAERYEHPWVDPTGAEWLSLNGVWSLIWVDSPDKRPGEEFYADSVDASAWDTISVPSCLEMKGYGDPYYINDQYPFSDNYPKISMSSGLYNSVASLRRTFTLPEGWKSDKRVVLHFDGLYSGAYVWVNGAYVGYTQGSNNDAEFDVSEVVREGENNVSVQLFRFTDGSYLEGQDMWHMSGIHRDVYLYATPHTYVRDHVITADLGSSYTEGDMYVGVEMENPGKQATTKQVRIRLYDPEGTLVKEQTLDYVFAAGDSTLTQDFGFDSLTDLQNWTAETPNLYTVEIAQLADGQEEMAFATKYGFRSVEIKSGKMYVNGERVFFKGVNTQDTHPVHGRAIDVPTMLRDVQMMKQANMNTIRGSHYPRQAKMYSMFDYYGLYCMDEADVECHYNWYYGGNTISSAESWKAQYIDRTARMIIRDRNFPSILFWSLGNESGTGTNLKASYDYAKDIDPTRYVHYEGATRGNATYTDIYSVMYPSIARTNSGASANSYRQPYFMCEYAHSMGNSTGNLKDYWDIIENSTYGMGGCIWDWVDQSIYDADDIKAGTLTQNGYLKYMSGYDYPGPHQGNFVNNGLIPAHRAWTPELAQVKQVYQYVKFKTYNTSTHRVNIQNAYNFTNLDAFNLTYTILEDGTEVESGTMAMSSCNPGSSVYVTLPVTTEYADGKEYCVNLALTLKEATRWADADYPVAEAQFTLQERTDKLPTVEIADDAEPLVAEANQYGNYLVSNSKVSYLFDKTLGKIRTWTYGDYTLLNSANNAFDYDAFRWIENDESSGNSMETSNGITTANRSNSGLPTVDENGVAHFTVTEVEGTYCNVQYDYTLYPDGTMDLTTTYTPQGNSATRRIGTKIVLPTEFEDITYYGRGPWDCYIDRQDASFLGRYSSTVSDFFEPSPRPQTSGNRLDVREFTLTDPTADFKLQMTTEGQVAIQVLPYDDGTMASAKHCWELTRRSTVLHLDYMQKGIGNGSCGQSTSTLTKYACPTSGTYTNTVRFRPIAKDEDTAIGKVIAAQTAAFDVKVVGENVVCTGDVVTGTTLTVYDLGGNRLGKVTAASPASTLSVSLAGQPSGTYIAKVGKESHKIIK